MRRSNPIDFHQIIHQKSQSAQIQYYLMYTLHLKLSLRARRTIYFTRSFNFASFHLSASYLSTVMHQLSFSVLMMYSLSQCLFQVHFFSRSSYQFNLMSLKVGYFLFFCLDLLYLVAVAPLSYHSITYSWMPFYFYFFLSVYQCQTLNA